MKEGAKEAVKKTVKKAAEKTGRDGEITSEMGRNPGMSQGGKGGLNYKGTLFPPYTKRKNAQSRDE